MISKVVVLPLPVLPTIPTLDFAGMVKLILEQAVLTEDE